MDFTKATSSSEQATTGFLILVFVLAILAMLFIAFPITMAIIFGGSALFALGFMLWTTRKPTPVYDGEYF